MAGIGLEWYQLERFDRGLQRARHDEDLMPGESPDCQGVTFDNGTVKTARGSRALGQTGQSSPPQDMRLPLSGEALFADTLNWADGDSVTVCMTTSACYHYSDGDDTWIRVLDFGASAVETGSYPFTHTYFRAADGTEEAYYFANGKDVLKYEQPNTLTKYDAIVSDGAGSAPWDVLAVTTYAERLWFLGIYDTAGGMDYPQRAVYTDTGVPSSITSGIDVQYVDMLQDPGTITAGKPLGDGLAVYKPDAIYRIQATTAAEVPFAVHRAADGIGPAGPGNVAATPVGHFFLGRDGHEVWLYAGGGEVLPVGAPAFTDCLDPPMRDYIAICPTAVDPDKHKVYFVTPSINDTGVVNLNTLYIYDWLTGRWERHWGPGKYLGWKPVPTGLTWNDLVGEWHEQDWRWCSPAIYGGERGLLTVGAGEAVVLKESPMTTQDEYLDQAQWYKTGKIRPGPVPPYRKFRFQAIQLNGSATNTKVTAETETGSYSTTLTFTDTTQRIPIDLTGRWLQVKVERLADTAGSFELKNGAVGYHVEEDT